MANSLLTIDMITNEAQVVLTNQLTFTKYINREYDDRFANQGAQIGDTLNLRLPVRYVPTSGPALQVQNSVESSVALVLNKQYQQAMSFSSKDMTLSIAEFSERFVMPAIESMANDIDNDGLKQYKNVWQTVGTAGTTPTSLLTYLNAGVKLDNSAAPKKDDMRAIVLNPIADATISNSVSTLFNPSASLSTTYETGTMKRASGFKWDMDQNVQSHTYGTITGAVTVATTSVTGASTIALSGLTALTDTLSQGDVFTVAGVYAVNPQNRQNTGQLQQFVVTAAATADGSGNITASISPSIVYDPSSTTSQQNQNVTALPASGSAVTFFGGSGQISPQNLAFHRDAFTFACADLIMPGGVDMAARKRSKNLNISIRMVRQYDINNDRLPARLDVLGGWLTVRGQLACRVAG